MKLFIALLSLCVFIVLLTGCSGNQSGVSSKYDLSTPQSAIEALFEMIRTNDSTAFMSMIAAREDIMSYAIESDSLKPQKNRRNQQQLKEFVDDLTDRQLKDRHLYLKRFIDIREDGIADGIKEWKDTRFIRATYERTDDLLEQKYPQVEFKYNDFIGSVSLGSVLIKSRRGWVIARPGFSSNMGYKKMVSAVRVGL